MRRRCVPLVAVMLAVMFAACGPVATLGGSGSGCSSRVAILLAGFLTATRPDLGILPNSVADTFEEIAPVLKGLKGAGGGPLYGSNPVYFSYKYSRQQPDAQYSAKDTLDALPNLGVDALHATVSDILQRCPSTSIDLIGHSLGGVVAWEYLVHYRDTDEGRHIAHAVTLDSPVNGLSSWQTITEVVAALGQPGFRASLTGQYLEGIHNAGVASTNQGIAASLKRDTVVATFASTADPIVLPGDATIAGFDQQFQLTAGCPLVLSGTGLTTDQSPVQAALARICLHGEILQDASPTTAVKCTVLATPTSWPSATQWPECQPWAAVSASPQPSIPPVPPLSSSAPGTRSAVPLSSSGPTSSQPSARPSGSTQPAPSIVAPSVSPTSLPSSSGTPESQPPAATKAADCSGVQFTYDSSLANAITGTVTQNLGGMPFIKCAFSGYPTTSSVGAEVDVYLVGDFPGYSKQLSQLVGIRSGSMDPGALAKERLLPWIDPQGGNYGTPFMIRPQQVPFQNGTGVRFVASFGQDPLACCGYLEYFYQGLASNNQYFVMARFDLRSPIFGQRCGDANPATNAAQGSRSTAVEAAVSALRRCIDTQATQLANVADSQFQPNLAELDGLVKSISVSASAVQALKAAPRPSCRPPSGPFQLYGQLRCCPDTYLANLVDAAALPQNASFTVDKSFRKDRDQYAFKVSPRGVDSGAAKAAFLSWLKSVCLTDDQIRGLDITYSPSNVSR